MSDSLLTVGVGLFVVGFAGFWLLIVAILTRQAGWPALAARYPDQSEHALKTFNGRSGSVGSVTYQGCLKLSACPSGLHVSVWRLFGPSAKPFLAPWSEIEAEVTKTMFTEWAHLSFGRPEIGRMRIPASLWRGLQQARSNTIVSPGR
jgi:hypothetical protein